MLAPEVIVHNSIYIDANRRVDAATVDNEDLEALRTFNETYTQNPQKFLGLLNDSQLAPIAKGEPPLILIRQTGDSSTDVIISQPPFGTSLLARHGNPNSLNTVVKTHLLDFTNRFHGLTDLDGNYMSTLVVGAADRDFAAHFSPNEHYDLLNGDFSPYARRIIDIMKHHGFEAGYFYGYSRAAAVGGALIRSAAAANIDIRGATLAEPTDFLKQSPLEFAGGYLKNYAPGRKPDKITGHWWDDGPQIMKDMREKFGDGSYIGNFLRPSVIPTIIGMSQDRLRSDVSMALERGIPVVLAYGENSGVAYRTAEIVINDKDLARFALGGLLSIVKVRGPATGHDWGENHLAHAAIFSDGLLNVN